MSRLQVLTCIGLVLVALAALAPSVRAAGEVATQMSVRPMEQVTVGVGVHVIVDLTAADGVPLANELVALTSNGEAVRRTRTDGSGVATFSLGADLAPGEYELLAVYAGRTDAYLGAVASATLVVVPFELAIETVPPLPGMAFELDGVSFVAGDDGVARIPVDLAGEHELAVVEAAYSSLDQRAEFSRWNTDLFGPWISIRVPYDRPLQAGFDLSLRASQTFLDQEGGEVDPSRVTSITLRSSIGTVLTHPDGQVRWYRASRAVRRVSGLESVAVRYNVDSVEVDGSNVVNAGQQRFLVEPNARWDIELLLFSARLEARDALFGFSFGQAVDVIYPNGTVVAVEPDENDELLARWLARGIYRMTVADPPGWAPVMTVALSRDQDVQLKVISYVDMVVAALAALGLALGLLHVGRPHLVPGTMAGAGRVAGRLGRIGGRIATRLARSARTRTRGARGRGRAGRSPVGGDLRPRSHSASGSRAAPSTLAARYCVMPPLRATLVALTVVFGASLGAGPRPAVGADESEAPIPVLAYYYIWFDEASWERAKIDFPMLGRYSSDDPEVMRQHVRWAKDAGIDGFIVSWKSTLPLDRRLEQLIEVARQESFKLAIIYQGLDFSRQPLPIERIAGDIDHFIDTYAADPVFDILGGPMFIWSGTWEYTPEEIGRVSGTRARDSGCDWRSELEPRCVLLLATERNVEGVNRLAGLVDGNAYYWSSVNPDTFPGYQEKLDAMAGAVRESDGVWVAPAAPGFDARLIGGDTVVERRNGDTLRRELDAAQASSPDAIGLISWNEFSENSHVEPSEVHGSTSLDVLADVEGGRPPVLPELDSSQPDLGPVGDPRDDVTGRILALGLLVGVVVVGSWVIARRQRSGPDPPPIARSP